MASVRSCSQTGPSLAIAIGADPLLLNNRCPLRHNRAAELLIVYYKFTSRPPLEGFVLG